MIEVTTSMESSDQNDLVVVDADVVSLTPCHDADVLSLILCHDHTGVAYWSSPPPHSTLEEGLKMRLLTATTNSMITIS